jgi:hypothetical protein
MRWWFTIKYHRLTLFFFVRKHLLRSMVVIPNGPPYTIRFKINGRNYYNYRKHN